MYKYESLYRLVQSMSPPEKGYFKKQNLGFSGEERAYIILFDLLAKMEVLDEKVIEKTFNQKVKNIHSVKRFLYEQLIKSLRSFQNGKDVGQQLRSILDEVALLNARNMILQSNKLIEKGIQLANKHNLYTYKMLLLVEKRQLLKYTTETTRKQQVEKITSEIINYTAIIAQVETIKKSHEQTLEWVNTQLPLRNEKIKNQAENLLQTLLQIGAGVFHNFNEQNFLYAAIANLYFLLNDLEKAIYFQQKTLVVLAAVDLKSIHRQISYAAAIFNLNTLFHSSSNDAGMLSCIKKLQTIKPENTSELEYINNLIQFVQIYRLNADPQATDVSLADVETFLQGKTVIPSLYIDGLFKLLVHDIKVKNWQTALNKIDILLSDKNTHAQISNHIHTRMLHILVHYKLQHFQLLPSLIRHAYRFLSKQTLAFEIEQLVLQFFKKLLAATSVTDTKKMLQELHSKIKFAAENKQEARVLVSYFNYLAFLEKEI